MMVTQRGRRLVVRPHTVPRSPLRAWSAADQLALDHFGTNELGRTLLVNDEFGALACGLAESEPVVWTDSALSRRAIDDNLVANGFGPLGDAMVRGDDVPTGHFDTVVIRVPKALGLLEHYLRGVVPCIGPDTVIVGTAMARHIHRSTIEAFEKFIGPTTRSLATRKARLIHPVVDGTRRPPVDADPQDYLADTGVRVARMPGVFSDAQMDVGTSVLLDVVSAHNPPEGTTVVDVGCGAGVIAATLAELWPTAHFTLVDVSDLAVEAARRTWELNGLSSDRAEFRVADGLVDIGDAQVDIVVTNPPFHQGHARDLDLTQRLLADASRVLKRTGCAYVVGQRHLELHRRMGRHFSSVRALSKHPTHVVLTGEAPPGRAG